MERMLDLEVTRRCNLRCDHCFVGWSRDWKSHLSFEVASEIVREGAGRFDTLHLTGGEPLAWDGLHALIDQALASGYGAVIINTNGTLLDEAMVAALARHVGRLHLSVSFDGPPALHDPVRGDGRFARPGAGLARALAAGLDVTVMTVVTPAVLAVLPEFLVERARAHPGLAGITLFPVGVGPSGSQKPGAALAPLTPDDLRLLAAQVALAWHAGIAVTVGAYPLINPLLRALGYPAERLYQCTAGRGRICVHADLSVSTCHPVREPVYGRWQRGLFDRVPHLAIHARIAARDYDGCATCSQREACGHCRAYVTSSGEPFDGNDRVCLDVVPGRRAEHEAQRGAAAAAGRRRVALAVVP